MALKILDIGSPSDEEKKIVSKIKKNFVEAACYQGSIAYALMSVHVMKPYFLNRLLGFEPSQMLYWNMCYGTSVVIYNRPSMKKLTTPYRLVFSMFGSWMFNYSSRAAFRYLSDNNNRAGLTAILLGYLTGRCFYGLLEAYLYFVDMSHREIVKNPTMLDFL